MHFDSVIVGAGPAGCMAARDLARAGARVAIVDGSHPREKACGGGVTGRALELLTPRPPATLESGRRITSAVFQAADQVAHVNLPSGEVLHVFPRSLFDAALLDEATASGAVHVSARATAIERAGHRWVIGTARGPVEGAWLLGADGPSGVTRKRVFRPFARRQLSVAAGSFVDEVTTGEIVVGFVDHPRGYLWSFPRHNHLAVGTCAQADQSSTAELHDITDAWLDAYPTAAGHRRRRYAWPIPSLSARDLDEERPAGNGWLLLGDAAGLVDPITREGIFFAMRSGQLAAEALACRDSARAYTAAVRDHIHAELKRAADLRDAVFRPRFTKLLIDALNRSASIRNVMIDLISGRQTYATLKRRLLSTLEVGLMWHLFAGRHGS
jgi:geranylgeranyl reductase family protein